MIVQGILGAGLVAFATAIPLDAESFAEGEVAATRPQCEDTDDILAGATSSSPDVHLDCSLTLTRGLVVSKRIIIETSGVTIDCNGGTIDGSASKDFDVVYYNLTHDMILIQSTKAGGRTTDVTVRDCTVKGGLRILPGIGIGRLREHSYKVGYPAWLRAIAPTRITFDALTIVGWGRIPVYFGPGVTDSQLINSELEGHSGSVAIYIDAESSRTLVKNNYIHTTGPRERVAIDASDYNRIIDNRFSALNNGGIYLYRNCGQDGVVRQTMPQHNEIINNVFYYDKYTGSNPAVFLGSRNGNKSYCGKDKDHLIGSGKSNRDFARFNVVMQNQIYKRPIPESIRSRTKTDTPNYVKSNTTVSESVPRLAGCYVPRGYSKVFIDHGEMIDVFRDAVTGKPVCTGYLFACDDGDISKRATATCSLPQQTVQ